jgi:hypothetical protein
MEPSMAEPIGNVPIHEALKDVRTRLASLDEDGGETRDGFASLCADTAIQHGDAVFLERRVIELEKDASRNALAALTLAAIRSPGPNVPIAWSCSFVTVTRDVVP